MVLDRSGRIPELADASLFRHSLEALQAELYGREIQSFLLECGPDLAFNALRAGIIDKIVAFVAPKILGARDITAIGGSGIQRLADAIAIKDWNAAAAGPDIVITGYVHRNH